MLVLAARFSKMRQTTMVMATSDMQNIGIAKYQSCWTNFQNSRMLFVLVGSHLRLADDLLLHVAGNDIVVAEFHRVRALPLRDAAKLGGIAGHFGQRGLALDDCQIAGQTVLVLDA